MKARRTWGWVVLLLAACRPTAEVTPEPLRASASSSASAGAMARPLPSPPASAAPEAPASPSASAAAVTSAEAPRPPAPKTCQIKITKLVEAKVYRGVRHSPSRQATIDRLSPEERQRWHGRDHAVQYLLCRYEVSLNGRPYLHEHVAEMAVGQAHEGRLDPKKCTSDRTRVERELVDTTQRCADPHAGAYWGFDLTELAPPGG